MATAVTTEQAPTHGASQLRRFVFAGLTVAVLDGLFAVVVYTLILHLVTAQRIFQSIATGLLGPAAFDGGAATAWLGVACHLLVAFAWTTAYFVVSRRFTSIREYVGSNRGALIAGVVVGAVIWLGMDFVVVPLSAARRVTWPSSWQFWLQLVWHMVGLGPPLVRILR